MKTIVAFIVGLLIATAWAQKDDTHNIVWLPGGVGSLNGHNYQTGLRHDGAIERVDGSGLELAAKQPYHGSSMRVGPTARPVVFGAAAG